MKNKNKMGLFIIKIALVLICLNKTYEEMKLKKEKRIKTIRILDGQDSTYDIDKEDETTIEESDISTKGIESSSIEKTDTYTIPRTIPEEINTGETTPEEINTGETTPEEINTGETTPEEINTGEDNTRRNKYRRRQQQKK